MGNQLEIIVQESNLEMKKAEFILDQFKNYFAIAAEMEIRAKKIVVTDASQKDDMALARKGRLYLREKRIKIEHMRKELKESALREGQAIDRIAKVLTELFAPIEKYLYNQEHFVEIQAEKERKEKQAEIERRMEQERIEKEKAEAEEQERIRKENDKLKAEAAEKERQRNIEREKERKEREAADKKHREEQARAEAEKRRLADEKREAEERAERERKRAQAAREKAEKEKKKADAILKRSIECPYCNRTFNIDK